MRVDGGVMLGTPGPESYVCPWCSEQSHHPLDGPCLVRWEWELRRQMRGALGEPK